MKKDVIDFLVVSYYRPEYIRLLIWSIRKFVNHPYLITVIANEIPDREEYVNLFKDYENDEDVQVIQGTGQVSFVERGGYAGVKWNTVTNDGVDYKYGPGSYHHNKGLTIGMKNTDNKYICFLDSDTVFLDIWVDDLLHLLDTAFLISSRFDYNKGPNGFIEQQFMFFKREDFEKYDLYPNCEYVDGCGNITKCVLDNKEEIIICENSLWNPSLKDKHLLNLRCGEQAFIEDKPFFYHYGRGSSRGLDDTPESGGSDDEYYKEWAIEVEKYLNK